MPVDLTLVVVVLCTSLTVSQSPVSWSQRWSSLSSFYRNNTWTVPQTHRPQVLMIQKTMLRPVRRNTASKSAQTNAADRPGRCADWLTPRVGVGVMVRVHRVRQWRPQTMTTKNITSEICPTMLWIWRFLETAPLVFHVFIAVAVVV